MLNPLPAVLVSCGTAERSNLITVAWVGTICTNPPMLYISVRPERFSYNLIKEQMEFTVNLTTAAMAKAVNPYGDGCACRRIVQAIRWHFGLEESRPADFRA